MVRHLIAATFALSIVLAAPRAEAKWFEAWGSALAGYGYGTAGTDKDFYAWIPDGSMAVGAEVGAKILFIGAFVDYLYWPKDFSSDGLHLLTINLGGDWELNLAGGLSLVIRVAGGFYVGLLPEGATVAIDGVRQPQNMTRGVGAHGGLGVRYTFASILHIGVTPEIGYHYFFGDPDSPANKENSHGFDVNLLAYFRIGGGF